MVLGGLIERGREDLALDRATDIRHFLGPLTDEHDHDVRVGVVAGDAVRDVLEERRLAGLRRRHDERALALAERVHQVDEPLRKVRVLGLEVEHLLGEDRGEVLEVRAAPRELGVDAVHCFDTQEREVLLRVLRRAGLAGDEVAGAQADAPHLARGHVYVLRRGEEVRAAEEAEAVLDDLEDALGEDVPLGLRLGLKDAHDDVVFRRGTGEVGDPELLGGLEHLLWVHLEELGDRVELAARLRLGLGARRRRICCCHGRAVAVPGA